MSEWLDPDNLEDLETTTPAPLNELSEESDQIAGEVKYWPVSSDAGNVRNNSPELIVPITHQPSF